MPLIFTNDYDVSIYKEITLFWYTKVHPDSKNTLCLMVTSSCSCKEEFCYQIYQKGSIHTNKPFTDMTYLKEWIEKIIPGVVIFLKKVVR
jgi:hypothetical protein